MSSVCMRWSTYDVGNMYLSLTHTHTHTHTYTHIHISFHMTDIKPLPAYLGDASELLAEGRQLSVLLRLDVLMELSNHLSTCHLHQHSRELN